VSSGLWIILLEAGLALGLLAFIVWWTLPKKPKDDGRSDPEGL
jgi:plastocyanin domain-containing protein